MNICISKEMSIFLKYIVTKWTMSWQATKQGKKGKHPVPNRQTNTFHRHFFAGFFPASPLAFAILEPHKFVGAAPSHSQNHLVEAWMTTTKTICQGLHLKDLFCCFNAWRKALIPSVLVPSCCSLFASHHDGFANHLAKRQTYPNLSLSNLNRTASYNHTWNYLNIYCTL